MPGYAPSYLWPPAATPTGCAMPARQAKSHSSARCAAAAMPCASFPQPASAGSQGLSRPLAGEVQRFFPVPKGSAVESFDEWRPRYPVFALHPLEPSRDLRFRPLPRRNSCLYSYPCDIINYQIGLTGLYADAQAPGARGGARLRLCSRVV